MHYPGTYLGGVYNRLRSQVQGRTVEDEHLVNAPNWLPLDLGIDGRWWSAGELAKQSDVLMLLYLLGAEQLTTQLARLGYTVDPPSLRRTVDYYLARTAHGSTLSRVVHASVLAGMDPARSWDIFRAALAADLDDTQGGTTQEGIHLGAMAGTIDIVTRSFAGMRIHTDGLAFTPRLPDKLHHAAFQVQYRGQRIDVRLDHHHLRLTARPCRLTTPVRVDVGGRSATIAAGQTREFTLPARAVCNGGRSAALTAISAAPDAYLA